MSLELMDYIFRFYGHLMLRTESEAFWHLRVEEQTKDSLLELRTRAMAQWGTTNPEALKLMAHGAQYFREQVAGRIYLEHYAEIVAKFCPGCGGLLFTPDSRQCRLCGLDWH